MIKQRRYNIHNFHGNISAIFLDQIDTKISHVYRKRR